jgi:N-methylhydantoinase B
MKSTPMKRGDEFVHIQAGAGGFGDPLTREPEKVLTDVLNEFITVDYAADVYGVVIVAGKIDFAASKIRRETLKSTTACKDAYLKYFSRSAGVPE